eukprot:SAG11_NODE_466_length_9212_cov_2.301986_7_plen_86_part_00
MKKHMIKRRGSKVNERCAVSSALTLFLLFSCLSTVNEYVPNTFFRVERAKKLRFRGLRDGLSQPAVVYAKGYGMARGRTPYRRSL